MKIHQSTLGAAIALPVFLILAISPQSLLAQDDDLNVPGLTEEVPAPRDRQ